MAPLNRIIWLASFPKSGNTWLRVFLANYLTPDGKAPGINQLRQFTLADVRQDFFDRAAGRPFVAEDFDDWLKTRQAALKLIAAAKPTPHFVKTHCQIRRIGPLDTIPPAVTAAAVYILRNPFDVAPSYARHLGCDLDTAIERMLSPTYLNATPTRIFEIVGRWDHHVASWTGAPGLPRHVLRYEDMKASPEKAFHRLLAFLKVPVHDGRLRRSIRAASFDKLKKQEQTEGFVERPDVMKSFFAKGQAGAWKSDLTPAQVARLLEAFRPALSRWYPDIVAEAETIAEGAG